MKKFELNKVYNFDVVFSENSFGHLILSPNGIIVTQNIQHDIESFASQEGMNILKCIIQPNDLPVTLFNLKRISKNAVINTTSLDIRSNIIYSCDFAIIGKHYNNINEVEIQGITITQNSVRQWLGTDYINVNYNPNSTTSIVMPISSQSVYTKTFSDFSLSFNFIPTFNTNAYNDKKYDTSYNVNFRFNDNNNLNTSLKFISKWQILHTLFTGQINNFDVISFSIPFEEPLTEQDKETAKQNIMQMYAGAEEDIINQLVENLSEQLPVVYFYMSFSKSYEEQLHFSQVPIIYTGIEKIFDRIIEKWFNLDKNMSQTIIYFFEALDKNKDIYQRFLSSTKLIEGFAEKYSETYFPEDEINIIKEKIKEKLKEYFDDTNNNVINDFTKALKYTNKNKINLEGRINKLIADNDIDYLNLNKELVKNATDYRNVLSHSVNINRMESLDLVTLYECYLKFLTFGFILLWKYLDIPPKVINYGIEMIKPYQELSINNKLKMK
jgi:hypothetical protein